MTEAKYWNTEVSDTEVLAHTYIQKYWNTEVSAALWSWQNTSKAKIQMISKDINIDIKMIKKVIEEVKEEAKEVKEEDKEKSA